MSDRQFEACLSLGLLALFLFVVFSCVGCSEDNPYVDAWNEGIANAESQVAADQAFRDQFVKPYFEKVAEDSERAIVLYRDCLTDVMYFSYWRKSGYGGGLALSVMYAADGSPLLYSEWLELSASDQEVPSND